MKPLIIIFSFLSSFYSIFAQGDSAATSRKNAIQNRARIRTDSFNARAKTIWIKADTLRFKADSLRFKANQKSASVFGYNNNYRIYRSFDSVVYNAYDKDTLVKEITAEVACNPDATVFIENIGRKLIIKTSTDNKVRITTKVPYNSESKLTDEDFFKKLMLKLKVTGNQVVLEVDNLNVKTAYFMQESAINSGTFFLSESSTNKEMTTRTITPSNNSQIMTIFIPANAKLDVESKYADVEIQNDLKSIKANITNASLRFTNTDHADIQGKYARINAGNIKTADIELNNGKFYAKDIYSAKFDSKYSNIEFGVSNDLKIESINDQYEIDEVTDLKANKNYGNIRITNLKNSFNLTGNNADIKIRNIAAELSNIKIDDKYADIRLPLNNITNYSVDFDGNNCNVYAPFEKIVVLKIDQVKLKEPQPKEPPTKQIDEIRVNGFKTLSPLTINRVNFMEAKDNAFKATVGDTKGKHAELQLKCTNCTVDFK